MFGAANTKALREEWMSAISKVEALRPEVIFLGHVKPGELTGTFHLAATKKYIRDFGDVVGENVKSSRRIVDEMLKIYPTRFNKGALLIGAMAAAKNSQKGKL